MDVGDDGGGRQERDDFDTPKGGGCRKRRRKMISLIFREYWGQTTVLGNSNCI